MGQIALRAPQAEDTNAIGSLLAELGYPANAEEVTGRLDALAGHPLALILVAGAGHEVFGVITSHIFPSLHAAAPIAWITTLVVSADARGMGVGTMLLEAAEKWAAENGAERVSLTSGAARADAHRFYESRGYDSTGLRFAKSLAVR